MLVGRLLSFWEGNFSGAMLNFGRVKLPPFFQDDVSLLLDPNVEFKKTQVYSISMVYLPTWKP